MKTIANIELFKNSQLVIFNQLKIETWIMVFFDLFNVINEFSILLIKCYTLAYDLHIKKVRIKNQTERIMAMRNKLIVSAKIRCDLCGCKLVRVKTIFVNASNKEDAKIEGNEKVSAWQKTLNGKMCKICKIIKDSVENDRKGN